MNKIEIIRNLGNDFGKLLIGTSAAVTANIALKKNGNNTEIQIEQGDAKQTVHMTHDDEGQLISADSRYHYDDKTKQIEHQENYTIEGDKSSFQKATLHYAQSPISDTARANIDATNSMAASMIGYKSSVDDYDPETEIILGEKTMKNRVPAVLDFILSHFPSADATKIKVNEKQSKSGGSIFAFKTLNNLVKGAFSTANGNITYHIDTPEAIVIGEQTDNSVLYNAYLKPQKKSKKNVEKKINTRQLTTEKTTIKEAKEEPSTILTDKEIKHKQNVCCLKKSYKDTVKNNPNISRFQIQADYYEKALAIGCKEQEILMILELSVKGLNDLRDGINKKLELQKKNEKFVKLRQKRNTEHVYTIDEYGEKIVEAFFNSKKENLRTEYSKVIAKAYLDGYNIDDVEKIFAHASEKYRELGSNGSGFSKEAIKSYYKSALKIATNDDITTPNHKQKT